ncbi:MAG: hypothetical protein P4N59_11385 [Negativicutes bacterium]|nr:hypothetical protein [Negativicutes bacterium]
MLWYNSTTGQLQSDQPWGPGYLAPFLIAEQYSEWQQVDDGFVPPTPVPTAVQLIATVNAEYLPQFQSFQQSYTAAQMTGNTMAQFSIQEAYTALQAEYNAAMEAIENGN